MSAEPSPSRGQPTRFRTRLLFGMLLLVTAMTALGLYIAQHKVSNEAQLDLQQNFDGAVSALHSLQEARHAALAERCRALVRRPRIHAALEDNALDLLYPSAQDELRDVMEDGDEAGTPAHPYTLRARFYRFLDVNGKVISPPAGAEVGELSPDEEAQLSLPRLPESQQLGCLIRTAAAAKDQADEVIAMPIISTESGEVIAALALGFRPSQLAPPGNEARTRSGLAVQGRVLMRNLSPDAQAALGARLVKEAAVFGAAPGRFEVEIDGVPCLLFFQTFNPASLYPRADELVVYPLTAPLARQRRLRWQVLIAGASLLFGAILASHFLAGRLSRPVEKLEIDSAEQRIQRARAEADLETRNAELQRSARFSADASHQLKTPVTVLRAGLEELLALDGLAPEVREELSALVHQTFRLTSMVEDLLLLSRMDAGRLQLQLGPVNLTQLLDELIDDLGALPQAPEVEREGDGLATFVIGEKSYLSLILQNLLENARKYNRPGGRIRITFRALDGWVMLGIGNHGVAIPPAAQEFIFERFHRGARGENVPGHGLGLNLARELARLHGGELRLARSAADWTEFELRLRLASQKTAADEPA